VVIAIIAILAGLLLPALRSARASALSVQCESGLRQIAQSMAMWSLDNDGHILPGYWQPLNAGQWSAHLHAYMSDTDLATLWTVGQSMRTNRHGTIWYCPEWLALDDTQGGNHGGQSGWLGSWYPNSYSANANVMVHYDPEDAVVGGVETMVRAGALSDPVGTMVMMDAAPDSMWAGINFGVNFASNPASAIAYPQTVAFPMHRGRSTNFLMADSHVVPIGYADLLNAVATRDMSFHVRWLDDTNLTLLP